MGEDWPFVRGNLRNTAATTTSGPVKSPELQWRHDAGARVFGTPLVVDGAVYVATCAQTHHSVGATVAIDRSTGDRLWMSAEDAMEVRGTPAVADGRLYLGDLDGRLFVLDTDDGAVLRSAEARYPPADGVYPLVNEETMYTQRYLLEAHDADTLELEWASDEETFFEAPVAVGDERLFAGGYRSDGEEVYVGLDEADVPEFVYLRTPFVKAIDPATGETIWETGIDGLPRAPAVVNETVFVPAAGSDPLGERFGRIKPGADEQPIPDEQPTPYRTYGVVYALDAGTGDERWSTRLESQVRTMPAADERYVCVGTADGVLVTLDATTGEQVWRRGINENRSVLSSPTIAGDVVYVGSDDDALVALDVATGDERWRFGTDAAVDANPSVVDGVVYIADNGGSVYALE